MNGQEVYTRLIENYNESGLSRSGVSGKRLASRISDISEIGRTEEGGSHRIGFSKEEKQAKQLVMKWMTEAGLEVKEDGAGNVFGRLEGRDKQLSALLSGSHADTVPNGGHFDGILGVLVALEVAEAWKETGYIPEYPYEVVIFSDEEGARFNDGFTGSRSMTGIVDMEKQKKLIDYEGNSFEKVLNQVDLTSEQFFSAKRDLKEIEAFIEVHIEQGILLEKSDIPVGIVSGIAGPSWLEITYRGTAGHAGNTPMNHRNDALVAAGELVCHIPSLPMKVSSTAVATVGKMEVKPNGINVIPGEVTLFVDIRDIYEHTRDELIKLVINAAEDISKKHKIESEYNEVLKIEPVPIKEKMMEKLKRSIEAKGIEPFFLPSGAGHDSMILGRFIPTAMLFVQSKDGISHNPLEWSSLNDCVHSVHVLKHFLENY
ncbi:hydantoinase/carbamoylase family amidase [Bacillus aerolatus]|uniref:Hydantoinase/carbamoylase family amidase n=1 Tax=Bacillus aerolatus TaxID=2653354 RepID=A0A6I1FG84_9BACI|nr:M20 family metallo-hydrolase [Bacillus aerolatus]KAB7707173.1 hydantoinase/carbamoylase family amidase [Bacillus aerolatus]